MAIWAVLCYQILFCSIQVAIQFNFEFLDQKLYLILGMIH